MYLVSMVHAVRLFAANTFESTFTREASRVKITASKEHRIGSSTTINPSDDALDTPKFPIEKLPPELRQKVYRYHLVTDDTLKPTKCLNAEELATLSSRSRALVARQPEGNLHSRVSLFLVSRQVFSESVKLYYHDNHFYFDCAGVLENFLMSLGPDRLSFITKITLRWNSHHNDCLRAFPLLLKCENLKSIHFHMPAHSPIKGVMVHGTLQLRAEQPRGYDILLKIRGIENLTFSYETATLGTNRIVIENFEQPLRAHMCRPRQISRVAKQGM